MWKNHITKNKLREIQRKDFKQRIIKQKGRMLVIPLFKRVPTKLQRANKLMPAERRVWFTMDLSSI